MAQLTGAIGYPHATSLNVTATSAIPPPIAFGTRGRDSAGNEFIYVDFDAKKALGEVVTWDSAFLTADLSATTTGPVGVVVGAATTSDLAGWVQIYGLCSHVLGSSSLTSGMAEPAATTDGYSVMINATSGLQVAGWNFLTSASTATSPGEATTASSILGVLTAMLNYPYITADPVTS